MNSLSETVEMMISSDYKERFKAEYYQLVYRTRKLQKMFEDWDEGKLDFEPKSPSELLEEQFDVMNEYILILRERAKHEGIEL